MGKDDVFFFEEDPVDGPDTGVTGEEQADTFLSVLEEAGIIKDRAGITSFGQMKNESEADTQIAKNGLLEIEFGVVKNDYVIHVTPTHPHKNLVKKPLFDAAVKHTVMTLNQVVPSTLSVDIFLPRTDFEIKATSYVVRDAADAWNFDKSKVEALIPGLLEQIGKICMQA